MIALGLVTFFSLTSCLEESASIGGKGGTTVVVDPNSDPSALTRLICDPFQTNSQLARDRGLFGNIYYLENGDTRYKSVEDYIQKGQLIDANIYLDRLFVQTKPFDSGFVDSDGVPLQIGGKKLFENYAVDVGAQLQLGVNEQPGYYQLALISDDGALLKRIDENGNEVIVVNNNGSHPTKMACASEPVYLDHNTKIPIKLQQYQGSRKNITMVAMWRPWVDQPQDDKHGNGKGNDDDQANYCGKGGNGFFFDSTKTPIKLKKPFYNLLVNKWKVLENENFEFPGQSTNPCAPAEDPLLLSGFSIIGVGRNFVTVTWMSNLPASSQIEIKNITTGSTVRSPLDVNSVLHHDVTMIGLSPNTLYSVRAISNTAGGQTVMTDERAFRTPR